MSVLDVWLDGVRVATLDDAAAFGMTSLQYTDDAMDVYGPGGLALSVRLPVRADAYSAYEARNWLDGLLPEGDLRKVLADRFRLADDDTAGLLGVLGRECAGAVTITQDGEGPPAEGDVHWLDEAALEKAVRELATAPFGVGVDGRVRISLGGVQSKLVLVAGDELLGLPLDATPSTHILKPSPLNDLGAERWPGVVHAELFGMRVLAHAGIDVAEVGFRPVGERPAILVRRYDRDATGAGVRRVHQEDLGQALGVPPSAKYQKAADPTTPSLRRVAGVLADHSPAPVAELPRLLDQVIASLVVGNCDQHVKNLSVVLDRDEGARLAPAYDVVATAALGVETVLSLAVGGEYLLEDVTGDTVDEEAAAWGIARRAARRRRADVLERLAAAVGPAADAVRDEAGEHATLDDAQAGALARLAVLMR
ncbi:HipA domain-containing protein [Cellulomonas septica]|uniref:Type II toxin-antitoxin system HipA family toxin n=1 Tax=Cellulomonas septica TaxID=285080 RepID=A0ABX1JZG4_9CELL|nr:HipA domain-containing protein [Cellulomonas septica]NKY39654.1 type II toxin-antitoxin system HipA family toxin [Cellulomonas septica]